MQENIILIGYDQAAYKTLIEYFTTRGDQVFFFDGLELDLTRDDQTPQIRAAVRAKTAIIDRLIIDIAGRPLNCPGPAMTAQDFSRLQEDYNAIALGTIRIFNALLPLLDAAATRQIALLTSADSSVGANQRVDRAGFCVAAAATNRLMSLMFHQLRPQGYSFRLYCRDQGLDYAGEFMTRPRCFEPANSERASEYRLAMFDAHAQEVAW